MLCTTSLELQNVLDGLPPDTPIIFFDSDTGDDQYKPYILARVAQVLYQDLHPDVPPPHWQLISELNDYTVKEGDVIKRTLLIEC